MNYFIEKKLIAVGVVDIFRECMSSVYYFYDPAYLEYNIGTVGALIEIEWIKRMSLYFPEFNYYYMGFYI